MVDHVIIDRDARFDGLTHFPVGALLKQCPRRFTFFGYSPQLGTGPDAIVRKAIDIIDADGNPRDTMVLVRDAVDILNPVWKAVSGLAADGSQVVVNRQF